MHTQGQWEKKAKMDRGKGEASTEPVIGAKSSKKKVFPVGDYFADPLSKHEARQEVSRRAWEVWDNPGVAEYVDAYWLGSPDERKWRLNLAALVKRHMLRPWAAILEVGSGTGLVYQALREIIGMNLHYVGVDNSETMLAIARKRFPETIFLSGDAFALPFKDGEHDLTCAFEVFGHMPNCSKAIAQLVRVARRTAIFSLWIGGSGIDPDGDKYVYSDAKVREMIDTACQGQKASLVVESNVYIVKKELG